jgi:hypothetical protein
MSLERELAKAVLAGVVSSAAATQAQRLRYSARQDPPGAYRESKRALADVADEVSENPRPAVNLLEALWDGSTRGRRRR